MSVSQYKDVAWTANENIATEKLNTMAANTRYLFERAPKMLYTAYGAKKDTGVKIMSGVATITATKSNSRAINIPFGSFFTVGCKPVVVTGVHSGNQNGLIATVHGLSGYSYSPDHRGFQAVVAARELQSYNNHIMKTGYLHWIAMGY